MTFADRALATKPQPGMTPAELEELADRLLMADADRERCPTCNAYEETLADEVPVCPDGHTWERGNGKRKGTSRSEDAPSYLTDRVYRSRRKHEVYPADGVPEPEMVEGIFHRAHRPGRLPQRGE